MIPADDDKPSKLSGGDEDRKAIKAIVDKANHGSKFLLSVKCFRFI